MVLKILQSFRLAQNIILLKDRMNKDKIIVNSFKDKKEKSLKLDGKQKNKEDLSSLSLTKLKSIQT